MIHWQQEGGDVRQGLSIYHPTNKNSIGGYLRIGNRALRVRYSKIRKRWHFSYEKVNPKAYQEFMKGHK